MHTELLLSEQCVHKQAPPAPTTSPRIASAEDHFVFSRLGLITQAWCMVMICVGAIFSIWWDGLSYDAAARKLTLGPMVVSSKWVRDLWELFDVTGDVQSHQGRREAPPANLIIDELAALEIINQILDHPEYALLEHHAAFQSSTRTSVHLSTFCKAVRRLGFSRQRVSASCSVALSDARSLGCRC